MLDLLTRRSIENPAVPLTSSKILEYLAADNKAASGMSVTRKTMLGLPAVFRGVNLIGDGVGTSPLHVFRTLPTGGKIRAVNHPAYPLVRHKPNGEMTAYVFKKTLQSHAIIEGSGYAQIIRNPDGSPQYLAILDPALTFPIRENGRLMYLTRYGGVAGGTVEKKLWAENVIHIKGLCYDGLTAYRLTDILKDALGIGMAAQRYGGRFFANDARPSILIEVPYRFPDAKAVEDFRARFGEIHGGVDNANKPAILEAGGKITAFGGDNEDAQFLQTREFEARQVANILGLPPHLLGDPSRTSFASLEQENKSLLLWSINPWLVNWESELRDKLLTEDEKTAESHEIRFERKAFMQVDKAAQSAFYLMALTHKVMVPNEVRELEDLNPIEGGDEPLPLPNESPTFGRGPVPPSTMAAAAAAVNLEDRTEKVVAAQRDLIIREVGCMLRRISYQVQRAAKKPSEFLEWIDSHLEADNYAVFLDALRPAVRAHDLLVHGSTDDITAPLLNKLFERIRGELLDLSGDVTADKLLERAESYLSVMVESGPAWVADQITTRNVRAA